MHIGVVLMLLHSVLVGGHGAFFYASDSLDLWILELFAATVDDCSGGSGAYCGHEKGGSSEWYLEV